MLELDPGVMYLERAHRLGRRREDRSTPRPVIVAFRDYYDTELILQEANKLRNTGFSIHRDYPHEIAQARKSLWGMYKDARAIYRNRVSIQYPARLVVNGYTKPANMIVFQIGTLFFEAVVLLSICRNQASRTTGRTNPRPAHYQSVTLSRMTSTDHHHVRDIAHHHFRDIAHHHVRDIAPTYQLLEPTLFCHQVPTPTLPVTIDVHRKRPP